MTKIRYAIADKILAMKEKGFFSSKKFLAIAVCLFMCSIAIAGGIIFNAGQINGTVSITDAQPSYYDVTIEGQQTPVIITESIEMMPDSTVTIEYNIANNEGFSVQVDISVIDADTGLTIEVLDGVLSPTTSFILPQHDNKYFNLKLTTDSTVTTGDTLTFDVLVKVQLP